MDFYERLIAFGAAVAAVFYAGVTLFFLGTTANTIIYGTASACPY